jgi:hypothetical protein
MIGYITEFDGVVLNSGFGQNQISINRAVNPSMARILGDGMYDLDGIQSPLIQTEYSATFMDENGDVNARALFQRLGKAGWLKVRTRQYLDSQYTDLMTWAKLTAIDTQQTPTHWQLQDRNPYSLRFSCRPYWYQLSDTTNTFTSQTSRTITNNGNTRSSWLTFYITSAITTSLTIRIGRSSGATYNVPKYGEAIYDATGAQTITYNASKAAGPTLMIDCRLNNVTLGGNDDYADIVLPSTQTQLGYLYPGSNRITFSQSVSGSIVYRGAYV